MQKVFQSYSDPGHGWAKVPKALLVEMGIEQHISHYSYQRNGFAYLEEDADLSKFCTAYRGFFGEDPKFRHHTADKRSRIRGYSSYHPYAN